MDSINEIFLHYLVAYDGQREPAVERTISRIKEYSTASEVDIRTDVDCAITNLCNDNVIELIPYQDYTEQQKYISDNEGKTYYRLLRKYE